jgi:hypothetical protein
MLVLADSKVRRFCSEICETLRIHMPVRHSMKDLSSQFAELLVKATTTYGKIQQQTCTTGLNSFSLCNERENIHG